MPTWLLLTYKVPSEPSARRVYVWRKLKRLGALLLHDAAWVLPANARTREQFQWLMTEILEMGGEGMVWEAALLLNHSEAALVSRFIAQVDEHYRQILAQLEGEEPDLDALARQYQQARSQDYFHSPLGVVVRDAIVVARGGG